MSKVAEELVEILAKRGESVTFAESCTAGLVAATFCEVAGASKVFRGSVVSYANEVKRDFLGVSDEVLNGVGAVSRECVEAMAIGAAKAFRAQLAVSVSGVAGPSGGTPAKPVGCVFIAVFYNGQTRVVKCNFSGDRQAVRSQSVQTALQTALLVLNES